MPEVPEKAVGKVHKQNREGKKRKSWIPSLTSTRRYILGNMVNKTSGTAATHSLEKESYCHYN